MSPKKKASKPATKKKTTAKKKPAVKKVKPAAIKKTAVKKSSTPKKKTAVKKKSTVKETSATKKTVAKKKPTAAVKAASKKPEAAKIAAPKKKVAAKKTVKNTKKVTEPKKAAPVKTSTVAKRKIAPRKPRSAEAKARAEMLLQEFGNFEPYKLTKGEEYMNDDQIEHFRNILSAWKHALMEEVDRTVHYMQDEAANFPDPNDRASQESDFTMELRARDRERRLIKKIEESINGLDGEEYGFCESCGVEIGLRRLEARPTASLCIDCKTLDEIREKQLGGR